MKGSWVDEISLINLETGESRVIYREKALVNDAHLQYFFNPVSVILNYTSPELEQVISPTDSRLR